ncbi:AraC family transcriptional regulator [Acidovorax sp. NCPPB 3576]|uniref:AraC family transcriptional regulator n=1 Tax=Acidovorax sp. NCPPB 3576 TaxID=2940488 RepID=UPI00234A0825|nr:AraC family transcriptional regulator [Acidovorax sp. NCPPB 3576]WCM88383.1 AraC family transcriptional regulator [Acidovorax sp. NCPPB 3576]
MKQEPPAVPGDAFEALRSALAGHVARWTQGAEQCETPIPGLTLYRHDLPTPPVNCMAWPSIALTVQGTKHVLLGGQIYRYHSGRFLITALELPVVMQAVEARPDRPYLSLVLKLDACSIAELAMQAGPLAPPEPAALAPGLALGETTEALLELFLRLVKLLDEPQALPVLAPLVRTEIFYRLLMGEQGARLWQMVSLGSQNQRIAQAIEWLKLHFAQPLRIEELAAHVQMSPSRFHRHFRALTAMSPLQFQKWLRLNEARRLMLAGGADASTAAFQVGYESPSQFSREYSRLFGAPPRRDVQDLRHPAGTGEGALQVRKARARP